MVRNPLSVAVVIYDGLCTFEFGTMVEIFGLPRPQYDSWYKFFVCGIDTGPVRARGGVTIEPPRSIRSLDRAGTIIIPGWQAIDAPVPPQLCRKLRKASDQGARILSVCSGAFVLAAAGLLNGKRATTHWMYAESLQRRFPQIRVDPNVLYVDEGNVLTSAGSAAGIDMGLHLVRRDFGIDIANDVARQLVVPPHRLGGQKQFVATPLDRSEDDSLAPTLDAIRASLAKNHSVEDMAKLANMSSRTFSRRFKRVTGETPHRWLQSERVRLAQSLLETSTMSVEQIADRTGFGDAQLLRTHFRRVVGVPPSNYRRTFRRDQDEPIDRPSKTIEVE